MDVSEYDSVYNLLKKCHVRRGVGGRWMDGWMDEGGGGQGEAGGGKNDSGKKREGPFPFAHPLQIRKEFFFSSLPQGVLTCCGADDL